MNFMKSFFSKFIRLINYEIYLQIKSIFNKSRPLNTNYFLNEWEMKDNNIADPSIDGVFTCLIMMDRAKNTEYATSRYSVKDGPILEIGAGYGRITKKLITQLDIFSIEPDDILFEKLIEINPNSRKLSCQEFNLKSSFSFAFSVRSLEYLNLLEMIIFFRKLRARCSVLICWENSQTIRRITKAALFSRNFKVIKKELFL